MKKVVNTSTAPSPIGPYSQGVQIGDLIFFSGQIPLHPETGKIPEGIEEQTKQVLENVKALLKSQQLGFENVIKTTVFLNSMEDITKINEVFATYFVEPFPARSAVEVAKLPCGALIEVEVIVGK
jgi:2-iminobutanoate/2-iminopropanoate deaminase